MKKIALRSRLGASWHSFGSLPVWVQIWVGAILIPVNAAAFFLLEYRSAQLAAWAALFVVATNLPIMLTECGMSKLMSLPHLLAWGPLLVALIRRPVACWRAAICFCPAAGQWHKPGF